MEDDNNFRSFNEPYHEENKNYLRFLFIFLIVVFVSFSVNIYQLFRWAMGV